jgi:hypothetical protein
LLWNYSDVSIDGDVKEDNTRDETVDGYHHAVINQWKLLWKLYGQINNKELTEGFSHTLILFCLISCLSFSEY